MAPNKYFGISRITSIRDWEELVGEKDWKVAHSAYELAQSWFRSDGLPGSVQEVLEGHDEFGKIEFERAFVEYPVGLDTGKSPSMNDLMVYCRLKDDLSVIAVEGKANESFDVKVEVWCPSDSEGKLRRLRFLENVLRVESEGALNDCYYQLLHRTASAVLEASQMGSKVSMMMIHSFSNDEQAKKKNWHLYKHSGL